MATSVAHPFLVYRDADGRERLLTLETTMTQASVGRLKSSDLALDWDTKVSRLHARLEREGAGWAVVDDGLSSNGTFVNGERVSGRRSLSDGDVLSFGSTRVVFRSPEDASTEIDLSTTQRRVLAALCRPYLGESVFANPPSDEEIAAELFLSVGAVKTHLTVLAAKFGLDNVPGDQRTVRLVERAIKTRAITERDV